MKIQKKIGGGGGGGGGGGRGWDVGEGGVRADVNEEFKLLWKCKKNISGVGVSGPARDCGGQGIGIGR